MSLERQFEHKFAGDLRKNTADKLRAARKKPSTFEELRKEETPPEYESQSIRESIEDINRSVFARIFKTEAFREKESILNELLQSHKKCDIEKIRQEYKERFEDILVKCPLTQEEKEEYLSTEALEKMSLDDYLILLKRLSGEAFYHVTRFGIREGVLPAMADSDSGHLGKFVNTIEPLLRDGNLKDCVTTIITNEEHAQRAITTKFIQDSKRAGRSVEEVVEKYLKDFRTEQYLDRESVHFSYGKDSHSKYGGENNYKLYFYYPVEYILHNDFYFNSRGGGIDIGAGYQTNDNGVQSQYNDFEIFNFGKGVPVDAGILCITGDVQVDPETGSQYRMENGQPVVDDSGNFVKPEKTITSKQYWENYFNLHPELRPSKVMYDEYRTASHVRNVDLKEWAEDRETEFEKDDNRQAQIDYQNRMEESMREALTEVVREKYRELD